MGYVIRMPKIGLEMERGTVLEWRVDEGEAVSEGDVIAEVESEKSIADVTAREDGVLRRVYVSVDETVPPGTPIGILAGPDEEIDDLEAEATEKAEAGTAGGGDGEPAAEASAASSAADEAADEPSSPADAPGSTVEVKASPRAERRAEELGVDLAAVTGTGPGGAITADDVESAAVGDETPADVASDPDVATEVKASPRAERRAEELGVDLAAVTGTGPGGAITADDVESAAEAVGSAGAPAPPTRGSEAETGLRFAHPAPSHVDREVAVVDADACEALFDAAAAADEALAVDVTVTDVLLAAASAALEERPALNATFQEATHHLHERQHIAVVLEAGDDPRTAVVADVADRSLAELVDGRAAAGDPATADASDDESRTATFTLSNAGDLPNGDAPSGTLVNPPAVASLDVSPVRQRAAPDGDGAAVDIRPYLTFALAYDVRAVATEEARGFLDALESIVGSSPGLLLETYRD